MCPQYSKKSFDNQVIGDERWVYYFELKRKSSKRNLASQIAIQPVIVKGPRR